MNMPARPRRRRHALLAIALTAALLTGAPSASADTLRTLQHVDVAVDSEGAVTSITSTTVAEAENSSMQAEERSLDPTDLASELPVRVLTSYRLGDRSGTDLDDIKGESGRVVVEVTIQNTTVRPVAVRYDNLGSGVKAPALVGVPLTVAGSVTLDGEDLTSVVTGADLDTSSAAAASTNGLVSQVDDDTVVQWSTVLAPPHLAASTTFRLVHETSSFSPPTFKFSVQPGVTSDVSSAGLINDVFGSGDSAYDENQQTIELVSNVAFALDEAALSLSEVETELRERGTQLGQQTLAGLTASQARLSSELMGLIAQLDGVRASSEVTLVGASDAINSSVAASIDRVLGMLGDPAAGSPPGLPELPDGACPALPPVAYGENILAALVGVAHHLGLVADATSRCRDGSVDDFLAAVDLIGAGLGDVARELEVAMEALNAERALLADSIAEIFGGTTLREQVDGIETLFGDVRQRLIATADLAEEVGTIDGDWSRMRASLTELRGTLDDIEAAVGDDGDIAVTLRSIGQDATAEADKLAVGPTSVDQQIDDVVATLAAMSGLTPADQLSRDGAVDNLESVRQQLAETETVLRDIAQRSDSTASDSVLSLVTSVVGDLGQQVDTAFATLDDIEDSSGSTDDALSVLRDEISALAETVGDAYDPDFPRGKPVNDFLHEARALLDAQNQITAEVDTAFAGANDVLAEAQRNAENGSDTLDEAGAGAAGEIVSLLEAMSRTFGVTADQLLSSGTSAVQTQRTQLGKESDTITSAVDGHVQEAIGSIASTIDAVNGGTRQSEAQLVASLGDVITQIGTPQTGGTGLLGLLMDAAAATALQTGDILKNRSTAGSFAEIRKHDNGAFLRQRAEAALAEQWTRQYGLFGVKTPDGGTSRVVFTFSVGKS